MNDHKDIQALLPFYLSGTLEPAEQQAVAAHLVACTSCLDECKFWQETGSLISEENAPLVVPAQVLPAVMDTIRPKQTFGQVLQTAFSLLKVQLLLVRSEIWTASVLVIVIGFIAALLLELNGLMYVLAPLVASAGVSMIYGQENDPAYELTNSTPVSQAQILLARLVLVFGYNLVLVTAAYLGLLQILPEQAMSALLLNWLAPMAFLSSLSLLLSLVFGSANAISAAYLLWVSKFIIMIPDFKQLGLNVDRVFNQFWENPALLFSLAGVITIIALITAQQHQQSFKHQAN